MQCRKFLDFFGNLLRMLKWMDAEGHCPAYFAEHNVYCIAFSIIYARAVQNSSIVDLGSVDLRDHIRFYNR